MPGPRKKWIGQLQRLLVRRPTKYVASAVGAVTQRRVLKDVERYCMFIGYPDSGHSLVGSLLDAHRNCVISHELNVLRFLRGGMTRGQILWLILDADTDFTSRQRKHSGYDYTVPKEWQGRFEKLQVIGDKRGGTSSQLLAKHPDLLHRLEKKMAVDVRYIHVVRNPFDNITTIHTRTGMELKEAITFYFRLCDAVVRVKERVREGSLFDLRLESLIEDPKRSLADLCVFLGLEPEERYLENCAGVVFPSPRRTRTKVSWPADAVKVVDDRISQFDHLSGYSFDT